MLNAPSACILGLVALIAAGGCGSGSGRPTVPPPDASSARGPSFTEPTEGTLIAPVKRPGSFPGLQRSFDPPLRGPVVVTGDPELEPLVAYLKASFAREIKDGKTLVIEDMTDALLRYDARGHVLPREGYQHEVNNLLSEASDQVPIEMIRDFGEKNREMHAVWPELTRHLPASLMTPGEHKAIFSGFAQEGWERFYAKYPDAYGIIKVSRVGFNRDKTLAFFYVLLGRGSLNALGEFHVLKK